MSTSNTLLLSRREVASLLTIDECIVAVEQAFKLRALGIAKPPGILGVHATNGGFHVKAGILDLGPQYFVAKMNANFPENRKRNGLPTIQGIVAVSDAQNGRLLALMDSIEITIIRTGAATGVAAKYLARKDSKVATVCGCGNQGRISLRALMAVRPVEKVFAFDVDERSMSEFVKEMTAAFGVFISPVDDPAMALRYSDICITCTPAKSFFVKNADIKPGAFIAAVGSDNEEKQEIDPVLLSKNKVVTDSTDQCASIGELHHAIISGMMAKGNVHGELGEIIARAKPGRERDDEVIIFDSTGTALQDVAAAAIVYEKALRQNVGYSIDFGK